MLTSGDFRYKPVFLSVPDKPCCLAQFCFFPLSLNCVLEQINDDDDDDDDDDDEVDALEVLLSG